jgi:hypothetical protein
VTAGVPRVAGLSPSLAPVLVLLVAEVVLLLLPLQA